MKLPFPLLGSTFISTLVSLGVAAVIYSVMVPTNQYNDYKSKQRDIAEEEALLQVEESFLMRKRLLIEKAAQNDSENQFLPIWELVDLEKEIALRKAKVEVDKLRLNDAVKSLDKTRLWSACVGLISFFVVIFALIKWERRERIKSQPSKTESIISDE